MSTITQTLSPKRHSVQQKSHRSSCGSGNTNDGMSVDAILQRVTGIKQGWDATEKRRRVLAGIKRRAELLSLVSKCAW